METESLAAHWSRIRPTLLDETNKNRLVPEKVAALPYAQKVKAISYLVSRRWPVVVDLVDDSQIGFMQAQGYSPGFTNQLNDFWIVPEQEKLFQRIEPETVQPPEPVKDSAPAPAAEPPTVLTPSGKKQYKQYKLPTNDRERVINDPDAISDPGDCLKLIAAQIRGMRRKKGLSGERLSKLIGSNKHQISRLESGRYSPNLTTLDAIFKAMGKQIVGLELADYVEPQEPENNDAA